MPLRRSRVEDIVLINVTTAALDHWTEAVEKAQQNVAASGSKTLASKAAFITADALSHTNSTNSRVRGKENCLNSQRCDHCNR